MLRRARSSVRGKVAVGLRRQLERLEPGTVVCTEYPLHSQATYGWSREPHPGLEQVFSERIDAYAEVLDTAHARLPDLRAIDRQPTRGSIEPGWENPYFSSLDAVVLYSELVERRPKTYLEVGSGNSTRFAARAIRDHDLPTRIVSVDPAPRAEIDALCDELHRVGLEDLDPAVLDQVAAGDIVLVDGSHIATMGSDVVTAFLDVLPNLPSGVLVGIDDTFLPWDYPDTWTDRFYSEQYLVAVLLLARDSGWRVHFPAWYAAHCEALTDAVARFEDPARISFGLHGTTIWLERV